MDVLPTLEADSFDAMLTDPPYGLSGDGGKTGFMGQEWDGRVPGPEVWRECLRVLKPGAFALVFGGTRTWHRLAVALEDAGFELRDTLMWLHSQGFPKSHDVSKGIDKTLGAKRPVVATTPETKRWRGYGTSLKPAWESVLLVQKPHSLSQVCSLVAHKLGDAICRLPAYVKAAEIPSSCSRSEWRTVAAPDSALWSAVERCSTLADLSEAMATLPSESEIPTSLSIALSWLDTLAALSTHASMFTTETASSLTTDLRTLNSLPWMSTPEFIIQAAITRPGIESNASLAASIFSAARTKLLLTLEPSALGAATSTGNALALRPSWEPILLVRKPTRLTYAQNALEHGTGALNINGARVPGAKPDTTRGAGGQHGRYSPLGGQGRIKDDGLGRWPANLIHDGSEEVVSLFPRAPGQQARVGPEHGPRPSVGVYGDYGPRQDFPPRNDSGSAARFFYNTRSGEASADSDNEGAVGFKMKPGQRREAVEPSRLFYTAKASTKERNAGLAERNPHPTVKPLALTEYLAKLLLPPERDTPRRILVPFAGSGSEMIGAGRAGWDEVVGIEREAEYVAIAEARLAHWLEAA